MNLNNRYLIKTSHGYEDFTGVKETTSIGMVLHLNDSEIKCTIDHLIFDGYRYKKASEFIIGDKIENKKIINIESEITERNYYDPVEVNNGNNYLSNNITHHNCAIIDECSFIRPSRFEEFIDAFLPSQSALSWKKNIILSTPKGTNHFFDLVSGASPDYGEYSSGVKEPGEVSNGYKLFKVHWEDVPRYRMDGSRMPNEEFMKSIVDKHGIIHWNQNYGLEFSGSSNTLISSDALSKMKHTDFEEMRDGKLKIYKYPINGHKYIMSVDPAKDGTDAYAVQIIDITDFNFEQVATAKLQIDYLLMPEFLDEWGKLYNTAYIIIENNEGAGQSCADQLYQTYEYENLHFDKDALNKRKRYPGFRTTTKSRKLILQTLKLFIENNKLQIHDKSTINEFFQFILINNKFQADDNAHDDMIMSLAIVFAPFCSTRNFDDMKAVTKNLYDNIADSDKSNMGELLISGNFDDFTDEDYQPKTYDDFDDSPWDGAVIIDGGFV